MERVWLVSYILAWLLVAAHGLTLVALLWAVGRIYLKRDASHLVLITDEGPEIHSFLPQLEGVDAAGRLLRSSDYRGQSLVLLLLSPGCVPCEQILRDLHATQRGLAPAPEFLAVVEGTRQQAAGLRQRYRLTIPIIADPDAAIRAALGVERTPYGFLVDPEGVVRMKGVVNHRGQLEGLVHRRGRYIGGLTWQASESSAEQAWT